MNFKGTVSVRGDSGEPLTVVCEVTDDRLIVTAGDGSAIGDWRVDELSVAQTGDAVVVQVDGESLTFIVRQPTAFLKALGATGTSDVAGRISRARQSPTDSDRVQPLLVAGLITGLLVVFGIVLWATGSPPFQRESTAPVAVVARTTATPLPTRVSTTTVSDDELFVAVFRRAVEPTYPSFARVSDSVILDQGYGLCKAASIGDEGGLDPGLGMTAMLVGALDVYDGAEQGAFVVGATLVAASKTICREHSRYIAEMMEFAANQ